MMVPPIDTLDIVRDFASVLPIRLITPADLATGWPSAILVCVQPEASGPAFFIRMTFGFRAGLRDFEQKWRSTEGVLIIHNALFVALKLTRTLTPWTCPFPEGVVPPNRFIERLLVQNFIAIPSPVFRCEMRSSTLDWMRRFGFRLIGIFGSAWGNGPGTLHRRNIQRLPHPPGITNSLRGRF